jgi:hypothetical protein
MSLLSLVLCVLALPTSAETNRFQRHGSRKGGNNMSHWQFHNRFHPFHMEDFATGSAEFLWERKTF